METTRGEGKRIVPVERSMATRERGTGGFRLFVIDTGVYGSENKGKVFGAFVDAGGSDGSVARFKGAKEGTFEDFGSGLVIG